ncbi:MAG TPA: aspartyl protease family protein [Flavobacteriaceae bacterium]|nr:aspartyl protease family protein [Flavobacteriaceae bacterium]
MILRAIFVCFFLVLSSVAKSQDAFSILKGDKSKKIRFKLVNNLIFIPVDVNGTELTFLLDTGVSKPIIFSFPFIEEVLKIEDTEKIYIRGLGGGEPVEAIKSKNNRILAGNVINTNQELYIVFDASLNFAPRLGMPVHGILGSDFFENFVVEINYSSKYIRMYNPETYSYKNCRKCTLIDIEMHNDKPYLQGEIEIKSKKIPVKLLIDSGGSDSLWLFENDSINLQDKKFFEDFLGHGLSGSVYGKRSKLKSFTLADFKFLNPNVAFPDTLSFHPSARIKDRNGSISGNILKRFNLIVDYKNKKIQLKKNRYFKEKFSYNKSGMELEHSGIRLLQEEVHDFQNNNPFSPTAENAGTVNLLLERRYRLSVKPAYAIVELRKNSPAEKAGLQLGDVIIRINGKETHRMELQQVMAMFYEEEGSMIRVKIERDGKLMVFNFKLENLL